MLAITKIKSGLIVSCQAPADSPLHHPLAIALMAKAAVARGAVGVRIDTPEHVRAVREQLPTAPIIGLWKRHTESAVYITPRFTDAAAIAQAGADVVAIDATARPRPQGETMAEIIARIHQELGKPVMADVDTLNNAIAAAEAGADLVGTTLYGYTEQTRHCSPPGYTLLKSIAELNIPAICEGGVASPQMAQEALELGAYAVVVGTAITGIDAHVEAFQTVFN
ncbi:MAG: N-acetylmannosamine-6-phosphate 2-epimerase [Cyanophyceae cyanobacterium]